eukprot:1160373-Pelagomonas_calceolata.AAC.17
MLPVQPLKESRTLRQKEELQGRLPGLLTCSDKGSLLYRDAWQQRPGPLVTHLAAIPFAVPCLHCFCVHKHCLFSASKDTTTPPSQESHKRTPFNNTHTSHPPFTGKARAHTHPLPGKARATLSSQDTHEHAPLYSAHVSTPGCDQA